MTLTECWNELLAMVPDTIDLHLEVSLHRYPRSRTRQPRIEVDVSGWGSLPSDCAHYVDAESCEDMVRKFRANVLPGLGLTPTPDVAKELDCEIGANA